MSFRFVRRALAGTVLAFCLSGCAVERPAEPPPQDQSPAEEQRPEPPEPVYRPFPTDTLYDLLVAEFAARRGGLQLALTNYLNQARATRDPGVAAQATRIARFLNAPEQALEAALLWAEVEPDSEEARFTAAGELARAGRAAEAFEQMRALHDLDGEANFTAIAATALDSPESVRREMLRGLESLQPPPAGADVPVARALLLQSLGENDAALALTQQVLAAEPGNQQAVLIEAQVWQNQGDDAKAGEAVERALAAEPDNARLRLHYARLLARSDPGRAAEQYRKLVEADPENGELRLSLALVYREAKQYAPMRTELEALIAAGQQQSAAHFYLGEDAERSGDRDTALAHYREVQARSQVYAPALTRIGEIALASGGPDALARAMAEARSREPDQAIRIVLLEAELLGDSGEFERAWLLLSEALARSPGEPMLLYARSMVAEKRRDLPALEADLREMIRQQPDSALALNALGYSLTNLSDRHAEALELITRALELQPEDPAILDSMGWVQFRLGRPEQALGYLQKAFERFPDPEVAAHLGEVLWSLGRREEALGVWKKGFDSKPDSPLIREAMQRLGASEPAPAP
jgi:tetratricopeptide (TPR) repeat protein